MIWKSGAINDVLDRILSFALGLLTMALGFLGGTTGLHLVIVHRVASCLTCLAGQFVGLACYLVAGATHVDLLLQVRH